MGDLVAEVMLSFVDYRGESSPSYYAFAVARRLLADLRRRPSRFVHLSSNDHSVGRPGPSTILRQREAVSAVRREAQAIQQPYVDAVRLQLDGLPTRDIAEQLGINENTVRSRLVRGFTELRERLAAWHSNER